MLVLSMAANMPTPEIEPMAFVNGARRFFWAAEDENGHGAPLQGSLSHRRRLALHHAQTNHRFVHLAKSLVVPLVGAGIGERPLVDHFAVIRFARP